MGIFDTFSRREKRRAGGPADVVQYHDLPRPFRVQVIGLWDAAIGRWLSPRGMYSNLMDHLPNRWWAEVFDRYTTEEGCFSLTNKPQDTPYEQYCNFFLNANVTQALDMIDLAFAFCTSVGRDLSGFEREQFGIRIDPDEAIETLNRRFRQHAIGYQFAGGGLIRVDSEYLHDQAVKPALALLHSAGRSFAGPQEEFMQAHAKYLNGEMKDAIAWAGKAFESTLKAIFTARKWAFDKDKDTATKLLDVAYDKELVPNWMRDNLGGLRSMLASGVPTTRNKVAAHGQGAVPVAVPRYLVAYVLQMAAAGIVFLIESHNAME